MMHRGLFRRIVRRNPEIINRMQDEKDRRRSFIQFIKFCIVGASNTLLGYAIYAAVVYVFDRLQILTNYDYVAGNVISWVISVAWSFYWNNRFVFNRHKRRGAEIIAAVCKCYASYAVTGLLLTNILSVIWIRGFGVSKYIAPAMNLCFTIPVNFLLNKFWAFGEK